MKWNKKCELESALIRREWRLQQQQIKAHQRKKEILIKEYEIQRKHKLKRSTENMSLSKGPEDTQINSTELHKIKVDIYNIPGKSAANDEIQRDIVNPEDVMVKRKAGEGARPIFEREELTREVSNTEVVIEHRKVRTVEDANLENKPQSFKRRSASLSLTRNRSHSYRRISSSHSRYEDYKQGNKEYRRSNSNRGRSRDRSRERKEDKRRTRSCHVEDEEKLLKKRRSRRNQSRSRERDRPKWDRDPHHNKSVRGRSTERRMATKQITVIEQVPIHIYYGNFLPRPLMVGSLVPTRAQVAFGGSRPPMWPIRSFGSRFPSGIDMYRLRPPGDARGFGPQYY